MAQRKVCAIGTKGGGKDAGSGWGALWLDPDTGRMRER